MVETSMKLLRKVTSWGWEKIFAVCEAVFVLLPTSPINMRSADRDSGVFLYIGWRITNGELPYRYIWDHKPPFVYYIDALGLALTGGSRWGVWLIELVALIAAVLLSFHLMRRAFGTMPAVLSSVLWTLTLVFLIEGGNLTTEYTLPLQFAALWLFYHLTRAKNSDWRYFVIGVMGGVAFFTKQTAIGVWLAIALCLTLERFHSRCFAQWVREMIYLLGGGLAVVLCVVIFFGAQGALAEFWDAGFAYNFAYIAPIGDMESRLAPILDGISPLARTGLFQFSILGYVLTIILFVYQRDSVGTNMPLLTVGLIDLPIELVLISLSGNVFSHYYMTILPALCLFSSVTFWLLAEQIHAWEVPRLTKAVFSAYAAAALVWGSLGAYYREVVALGDLGDPAVVSYVQARTGPQDYVLVWGAESQINFFSERKSPTRFVYQYPLYQRGYTNPRIVEEFLTDVIRNRPKLIIDTNTPGMPLYGFPVDAPGMESSVAYLRCHYRPSQTFGTWIAYEYAESCP